MSGGKSDVGRRCLHGGVMAILFFVQCVFMGIAYFPHIRVCEWCYATWVLTVPFSLGLSLILDIYARGREALDDPFFVLCGYYALGLSLMAVGGFLFLRYRQRHSSDNPAA